MINHEPWLERLAMLLSRFDGYGFAGDVALMDLIALWGLYRFLSHLAVE